MCIPATGVPTFVPADEEAGHPPGLLLWKVLRADADGEHRSPRGLAYPLGQIVVDPNGVFGDHQRCLHLLPTREAATRLFGWPSGRVRRPSVGHHVVGLLVPLGRVWTAPEWPAADQAACWHTDRCLPLCCLTCEQGAVPASTAPTPRPRLASSIPVPTAEPRLEDLMPSLPAWSSTPTADAAQAFLRGAAGLGSRL